MCVSVGSGVSGGKPVILVFLESCQASLDSGKDGPLAGSGPDVISERVSEGLGQETVALFDHSTATWTFIFLSCIHHPATKKKREKRL